MAQMECKTVGAEYLDALSSVRCAKNLMLLIVLLCIGIQAATMVAVEFYGVLDASVITTVTATVTMSGVVTLPATTQPATSPASSDNLQARDVTVVPGTFVVTASDASVQAATIRGVLSWLLPLTKFLAPVAAMIAAVALALAAQLVLVGHFAGARGYISAFFWTIVLLVMLLPWQQMFKGSLACGALFNLDELTREVARFRPSWGAGPVELQAKVLHWARFLGYPGVAMLVWLLATVKSALASGKMKASTALGGQA